MKFKQETLSIANQQADQIAEQFRKEVEKLIRSGGVDPDNHNRGLLFGVALENIADNFLRGSRKSKEYKNLKCF